MGGVEIVSLPPSFNTMQAKLMNTDNSILSLTFGFIGGFGKYLLQVQSTPFLLNILGAIITAMLCGAAGVAGKEGYLFIKVKIQKFKRGNKR